MLVFEVLTLPVDVFVIICVLESFAEKVELRVDTVVFVIIGDVDGVFDG